MAALDDRQDVYDRCVAMGLDPDRVSHLERARSAMYAEFDADYEARQAARTPEEIAEQVKNRAARAESQVALIKLFTSRYGKFAPKVKP
jgi:hypothetical protein